MKKRKYIEEIKKIFFSRTTGPNSTKPATVHPWVKVIQVCSNEELFNSHKVDNEFFLLLINFVILISKKFSQVSVVAHGPLVNVYVKKISFCLKNLFSTALE